MSIYDKVDYDEGFDETNEATVMGAGKGGLAGFMIGGPIGAGIGAGMGGLWGKREYESKQRAYAARRKAMERALKELQLEAQARSDRRDQAQREQMGFLAPAGDLLTTFYGPQTQQQAPARPQGDPFAKLQQTPTRDPFTVR